MKGKEGPPCVGIIGPTNVVLMEQMAGLLSGTLEAAADEIGVFLAQCMHTMRAAGDDGFLRCSDPIERFDVHLGHFKEKVFVQNFLLAPDM